MHPHAMHRNALAECSNGYAKARVRTGARGLSQIMRLLQVASILLLYKNLQSDQQNNTDDT